MSIGIGATTGGITAGIGSLLSGNAASQAKKRMEWLANNTPGVNVNESYGDSLGAMQQYSPQAQAIARQNNTFNAEELNRLLETSMPGYADMQKSRIGSTQSMLRGELPDDVAKAIYRNSAAKSLEGGFAGSGSQRNLTARDLGLTSLDLIGKGQTYAGGIIGSTPMAKMTNAQDLLNIDPQSVMNLRSKERSEKLNMLAQAAGMPGMGAVMGGALQQIGSTMAGSALGGMMGGK